jgi:hypothetical protein
MWFSQVMYFAVVAYTPPTPTTPTKRAVYILVISVQVLYTPWLFQSVYRLTAPTQEHPKKTTGTEIVKF